MTLSGNEERRRILKNILYAFVIWVLFNHTVKFAAPRVSGSQSVFNYVFAATLKSLDLFRVRTGEVIARTRRFCPDQMEEGCGDILRLFRQAAGVD